MIDTAHEQYRPWWNLLHISSIMNDKLDCSHTQRDLSLTQPSRYFYNITQIKSAT